MGIKKHQKCTEENVGREVIANQLLISLEDKSKVALLITEKDLNLIIAALLLSETNRMAFNLAYRAMRLDLEQLRDAAFKS
jgi:hypothetical protein